MTLAPLRPHAMADHNATPLSVDVVRIIEFVKQCQARHVTPDEAQECFRDIHTKLCHHMSSILTSPLTGRMFVPMPTSLDTPESSAASLAQQLGR